MSLHFHTATEKSLKHNIRHGSASILHIAVLCYNTYNYMYILENYVATFVTTEMWKQCYSPLQWAAAAQVSCTLHLLKWVRRASHTPPHGLHWWQWPAEGCIEEEEHGTTCSAIGGGLYTRVVLKNTKWRATLGVGVRRERRKRANGTEPVSSRSTPNPRAAEPRSRPVCLSNPQKFLFFLILYQVQFSILQRFNT